MSQSKPNHYPQLSPEKLNCLYGVYRDYMKHEDDLLNHRTTWHQLIQGFLFATLGVLGQWKAASELATNLGAVSQYLVEILSAVGVLVALASFISCLAANQAIDKLEKKWDKITESQTGDAKQMLPGLAGAGDKGIKNRGKIPALFIPPIVLSAWITILCLSIVHHSYGSQRSVNTELTNSSPRLPLCSPGIKTTSSLGREELVAALGCSESQTEELRQELRARFGMTLSLGELRGGKHRVGILAKTTASPCARKSR